jgi:hypothetical protein
MKTNPTPQSTRRDVARALSTRPLTGIVLLDLGVRYGRVALRGSARWALALAAGALISFCAVVAAYPGGGAS